MEDEEQGVETFSISAHLEAGTGAAVSDAILVAARDLAC